MRNFLWYIVCASNFYVFLAFTVAYSFVTGQTETAVTGLQAGGMAAAINLFTLGGYFLHQKVRPIVAGLTPRSD